MSIPLPHARGKGNAKPGKSPRAFADSKVAKPPGGTVISHGHSYANDRHGSVQIDRFDDREAGSLVIKARRRDDSAIYARLSSSWASRPSPLALAVPIELRGKYPLLSSGIQDARWPRTEFTEKF